MGLGDALIGSGIARGAKHRGRQIAFGNGKQIVWTAADYEILRGNPNVAKPGTEKAKNLDWVPYYRGHRLYGTVSAGKWVFHDFKCRPGEVFLDEEERAFGKTLPEAVIIEPRVKPMGACAGINKQWPVERYQAVADQLGKLGYLCVQLIPPTKHPLLCNVATIYTNTFRHALALLERAELYIGPEGGLHHSAAAMGADAVVIFGGFNTPRSTGYDWHHNITVGEPCGMIAPCKHCKEAMASISVEQVLEAAVGLLHQSRVPEKLRQDSCPV